MHRPEVLFADEPATGLDVPSAKSFRQLMRRTVAQGSTAFLTAHNLFQAEELTDEVAVLPGSRISASAMAKEPFGAMTLTSFFRFPLPFASGAFLLL